MKTLVSYAAVVLVAATTTGCIIPVGSVISGKRIEKADRTYIQSEGATLSNVVERIGKPTAIFEDLRVMAYEWTYLAYELWGSLYSDPASHYTDKVLFVATDEAQRVKRAEVRSRSYGKTLHRQAAQWLTGVASKKTGKSSAGFSPVTIPPEKAVLYVYRPGVAWSWWGLTGPGRVPGRLTRVRLDGRLLTEVGHLSYGFCWLPGGLQTFRIEPSPPPYTAGSADVPLEVVPGHAYYLRLSQGGWKDSYKLKAEYLAEAEALAELQRLKLQE